MSHNLQFYNTFQWLPGDFYMYSLFPASINVYLASCQTPCQGLEFKRFLLGTPGKRIKRENIYNYNKDFESKELHRKSQTKEGQVKVWKLLLEEGPQTETDIDWAWVWNTWVFILIAVGPQIM